MDNKLNKGTQILSLRIRNIKTFGTLPDIALILGKSCIKLFGYVSKKTEKYNFKD